ncbi:MAG: 6-carboxytetrahydropterin synthase, partial [Sedimentisphaerales bacterium]|nr:6-carboxytetrahydropterin synthase [Sedimentisphaerales bacterium]
AVEIVFNAGHFLFLPVSDGKCEQPHRHDWRTRATVEAEELGEFEMVMDFQHLRQLLRQIVRPMEQAQNINELPCFSDVGRNPSTERIARYIYDKLAESLPEPIGLTEVLVWETPDCRAGYRHDMPTPVPDNT